jgi:hypothetical protein
MWTGIRIIALAGAASASCALALSARSVHLHAYQAAGRSSSQRPAVNPPVPVYKVAPAWPKMPLRNKYLLQGIPTMVTDRNDHIWVLSRPRDIRPDENGAATTPPRAECCVAAPAILEFDTSGNLLRAWGGPGHHPLWPENEHTIVVDRDGNVWLSASGRGEGILKFTGDGTFLWDFGHRGPKPQPGQTLPPLRENNQDTETLANGVFIFTLDEEARELYLVEGKRVLVYDMDKGTFKRGWGGHGKPLAEISNDPTPPYDWRTGPPPDLQEFAPALHCIHISVDGLVYVCERGSNRIQVFTKEGQFVSQFFLHPSTPARGPECGGPGHATLGMCGTIYNLTFSHDPEEKYLFAVDGTNHTIWIHDRKNGNLVGSIGSLGRMAGQFFWIDAIAMDSLGNLYTGEVWTGKRIQKFNLVNGDGVRRFRPHE